MIVSQFHILSIFLSMYVDVEKVCFKKKKNGLDSQSWSIQLVIGTFFSESKNTTNKGT